MSDLDYEKENDTQEARDEWEKKLADKRDHDKPGWLKPILQEACDEMEKRPHHLKPPELRKRDHVRLTDERLAAAITDTAHAAEVRVDGDIFRSLVAELRELRKLQDEVEPVLRDVASPPTTDPVWTLELRSRAYDILARHFGKEKGE